MAWRDEQGRAWNARRPDGWPNDVKAPDGYTVAGFRRITKAGAIRFAGCYWEHPRLLENPGRWVRVAWGGIPGCFTDERAKVFFGDPEATPENYMQHHSSFYGHDAVLCDSSRDWNKRPVTK